MKKLLKVLAVLVILSCIGAFGEEYQLVLPSVSSIAECAEDITSSITELLREIHFKGADQSISSIFFPLGV